MRFKNRMPLRARAACVMGILVLAMAISNLNGHIFVHAAEQQDVPGKPADEKISLDLKGIEVVELLRILSEKTGLTIVPSKAVSGRINVFLNNVSFEDALDIVLYTQNLAAEREEYILYIMTDAEYYKLYGREYVENREYKKIKLDFANPSNVFAVLEQIKSDIGKVIVDEASGSIILLDIPEKLEFMEGVIRQLDTALEVAVFDLNYAVPDDIKEKLAEVMTPNTGQILVDTRSSKLIISDLPSKMKRIKEIVKNLDEEDQEVFIEAEIIQINLNDAFQRGVDWEKLFNDQTMDGLDLVSDFSSSPSLASFGKLSVGTIAQHRYTFVIELLKTYGDVKILSRPRIAAMNNQEAKILVGTRDAFVTNTLSQAESTTVTSESIEFIDVGVKLNVTPTINSEKFITMKIKPEVSSVSETITTTAGSRVPIVETSEAETVVRVKDGVTIMIGGLLKRDKRDEIAKVPVLADIPILGNIFSSRNQSDQETELVIFLTPHLISGDTSLTGHDIEKFMPLDIMPEDIKKDIFLNEIEKIKPVTGLKDRDPMAGEASDFTQELKGLKED